MFDHWFHQSSEEALRDCELLQKMRVILGPINFI